MTSTNHEALHDEISSSLLFLDPDMFLNFIQEVLTLGSSCRYAAFRELRILVSGVVYVLGRG